jgi:hypothetical protein
MVSKDNNSHYVLQNDQYNLGKTPLYVYSPKSKELDK